MGPPTHRCSNPWLCSTPPVRAVQLLVFFFFFKYQPHRKDNKLVSSPWKPPPSLCCWAGMQWWCSSRWRGRLEDTSAGCRWRPPGRRCTVRGSQRRLPLHISPCWAKVNKDSWNIRIMSSDWWQQVLPELGQTLQSFWLTTQITPWFCFQMNYTKLKRKQRSGLQTR